MTSSSSSNKKSANWLADLKSYWWLTLICAIVYFFAGPVVLLLGLQDAKRWALSSTGNAAMAQEQVNELVQQWFYNSGLISYYICGMIIAVVLGVVLFAYLHQKRQVFFYHSMPITRTRLFAQNVVTGILINFVPMLLMLLLMVIIAAANGAAGMIPFGVVAGHVGRMLLFFLLSYGLTLLAGQLTGTVLTQLCMAALLQFGLLAIGLCGLGWLSTFLNTFDGSDMLDLVLYLSPLTLYMRWLDEDPLIYQFDPLSRNSEIIGLEGLGWPTVIVLALIAVAVMALAWWAYQKRPSEAAGSPLIYGFTKPVVQWVVMFMASTLGGLAFLELGGKLAGIFGLLSMGFLAHMFTEVIIRKDFKAMLANLKGFALYAVLLLAFCFGLYFDVTGYDDYLPENDQVAAVRLNIGGLNGGYVSENSLGWYQAPEDIALVTALVGEIVDSKAYYRNSSLYESNPYRAGNDKAYSIDVIYELASGRQVSRTYSSAPLAVYADAFAALYDTVSFKENSYRDFLQATASEAEDMTLEDVSTIAALSNAGSYSFLAEYDPNADMWKRRILQAMQQDLPQRTFAEISAVPEYRLSFNLRQQREDGRLYYYSRWQEFMVYPTDTNTMAVIAEMQQQGLMHRETAAQVAQQLTELAVYRVDAQIMGSNIGELAYRSLERIEQDYPDALTLLETVTDQEAMAEILSDTVSQNMTRSSSDNFLTLDKTTCVYIKQVQNNDHYGGTAVEVWNNEPLCYPAGQVPARWQQ